ncbi:MAG: DNA repair protein RecN [Urechidicola sp.]|nr:DNA repair protein RecN [Urechidicola sp.]
MLTSLSIKNYALIQELHVTFDEGFSIITGETGAGKSILLGALGLVLGKRADVSYLKDATQKCFIEAQFNIRDYELKSFFDTEDLDYEELTILRREILPSGKSRAFINDTPTTLNVLTSLSEKLIDIHSQHQTLELSDTQFQFRIIDALASNESKIASYKRGLVLYNQLQKELKQIESKQLEAKQQYEYNLHLFNELELAGLKVGEQEKIETTLDKLNNVETIKLSLDESYQIAENEEYGIVSLINTFKVKLQQIAELSKEYKELFERIQSLEIEFKDIVSEVENLNEAVQYNPSEIEKLNDKLQMIYDLQKKHSVATITELLAIQEVLSEKVYEVENSSKIMGEKMKKIEKVSVDLNKLAKTIRKNREVVIPKFKSKLETILESLGMENARFEFKLLATDLFLSNGKDELKLLFSANKGANYGELKKIASGGELSRIMLAVKSILASYINLPTIIFDEIDSGVSGEISNRMGDIMQQMSKDMQVISITHLPQIAGKGLHHFKVYKEDVSGQIITQLKKLDSGERISEIAEMLGGKDLSDAAKAHARELLN